MLKLALLLLATTVAADANASPFPPWGDLATKQSSGSLQVAKTDNLVDHWLDQCVHPFANLDLGGTDYPVSNHQLYNETSGLCMVQAFCAHKECNAGRFSPDMIGAASYNSTLYPDDIWKNPGTKNWAGLNFPAAVVHPRHVGDISAAIKFAIENNIQLSVKTSGLSYTGASTKDKSLLLNLFRLKQYAHPRIEYDTEVSGEDLGNAGSEKVSSIVECQFDTLDPLTKDGYRVECALAVARNKEAVIRVGDGETWDLVLKAVSETWNNDATKTKKYHIVSGSAATVSAAGGWLASGGLSGNNGMRMHGVGVDQVLHVEMVLPKSGVHVRFGPTAWEMKAGMMYPQTMAVTGYCNKGALEDEAAWDWQECDESINFMDLWHAVRGGGGGAYWVVTAIYYQLHEYSELQVLADPYYFIGNNLLGGVSVESVAYIAGLWYDFFLKFFFHPAEVGVTKEASNSCSGATSGPLMFCYHGGGDVMIAAWERYCKTVETWPTDIGSDSVTSSLTIYETHQSWFHKVLNDKLSNPNIPSGRGIDVGPLPTLTSTFFTYPGYVKELLMFTHDALVNSREQVLSLLAKCVLEEKCAHSFYIMGGNIPVADDGQNSLPIHRCNGGFLMTVRDESYRTQFNQLFYGVKDWQAVTGDDFPGALCHNHASLDYPTPLKEDWTKGCDVSSEEERKAKCFSYQETAWGTKVLKKLECIHSNVDPNRFFSTSDSVGYYDVERYPDSSNGAKLTTSVVAFVTSAVSIVIAVL